MRTSTKEELINEHAYLCERLEARVNAEGSWFYMNDLLDLLLDAMQAVRSAEKAEDDDFSVDPATAKALADVAVLIHCIANGSVSRNC